MHPILVDQVALRFADRGPRPKPGRGIASAQQPQETQGWVLPGSPVRTARKRATDALGPAGEHDGSQNGLHAPEQSLPPAARRTAEAAAPQDFLQISHPGLCRGKIGHPGSLRPGNLPHCLRAPGTGPAGSGNGRRGRRGRRIREPRLGRDPIPDPRGTLFGFPTGLFHSRGLRRDYREEKCHSLGVCPIPRIEARPVAHDHPVRQSLARANGTRVLPNSAGTGSGRFGTQDHDWANPGTHAVPGGLPHAQGGPAVAFGTDYSRQRG
mmetsp:Transcript_3272/g.9050  ORF Transcript_3272/g.9050 Transcript_3272/m.9050 type:complete len:267 (-) Transcript_3272:1095-1895(-)